MTQPVLLAVDDDADTLGDVQRELEDRYARHYRIVCVDSALDARARLVEMAAAQDEVALVLAAQSLAGTTGSELLAEVRRHHPHAKRSLLIEWGDWGLKDMGQAIFDGIAQGHFDHYMLRPATSPDELFHQTISGLLLEWAESQRASPYTVHVIGESWTGRAYELRSALQACAIAHHFCLVDSEQGKQLMESVPEGAELPLLVFPNGTVLQNPTNAELALAAGSPVNPEEIDFDVVIVGGGPAGLSAAVYGASEGFRTLVVDSGGIGGQATSSSLIRNYLGFPRGVSGRRLAQNAYSQAWVFGADFAFMQTVTGVERDGNQLLVSLSDGGPVRTRAVLLAMGASYRRIDVESIEALVGAGVYYGGPTSEAPGLVGRDVFIVGGANSAGQAAIHLARYAKRVTLVIRADSIRAGMSEYLAREVEATDNIEVLTDTGVVGGGGDGRLEHLVLRDLAAGTDATVDAQALFLLIGAKPNTDWLPASILRDEQGFVCTGGDLGGTGTWTLDRDPFLLETSLPGVFAAGDVRHGGVRRVASAVGEGSIAIQLLHQLLALEPRTPPGEPAVSEGGRSAAGR